MLDFKDLKAFYDLPSEFNSEGLAEIKSALTEYDDYRAYIVGLIEEHGGEDGYKNSVTYEEVEATIKWCKTPNQDKLLAVLNRLRKENCNE